jgi:hypothetical protein
MSGWVGMCRAPGSPAWPLPTDGWPRRGCTLVSMGWRLHPLVAHWMGILRPPRQIYMCLARHRKPSASRPRRPWPTQGRKWRPPWEKRSFFGRSRAASPVVSASGVGIAGCTARRTGLLPSRPLDPGPTSPSTWTRANRVGSAWMSVRAGSLKSTPSRSQPSSTRGTPARTAEVPGFFAEGGPWPAVSPPGPRSTPAKAPCSPGRSVPRFPGHALRPTSRGPR